MPSGTTAGIESAFEREESDRAAAELLRANIVPLLQGAAQDSRVRYHYVTARRRAALVHAAEQGATDPLPWLANQLGTRVPQSCFSTSTRRFRP